VNVTVISEDVVLEVGVSQFGTSDMEKSMLPLVALSV
jgi:hypothetical protein